jgi:hypothetical protein
MKTGKIEISVPDDIDEKSAQECFNLGLRVLTGVYMGGAFVAYTTEELKEQGIVSILFKNESAAAIVSMSQALTNIENNVAGEKIEEINKAGDKILDNFVEQKNSKNGN